MESFKNSVVDMEPTAGLLEDFYCGAIWDLNMPYISTGFPTLDEKLGGGLHDGLYVLGGISGLGKTTLVTQIADNIATAGTDVLIFSPGGMTCAELVTKSLSRLTYLNDMKSHATPRYAKTAREIAAHLEWTGYGKEEEELMRRSEETYYKDVAPHVYVQKGTEDIGVKEIRETVKYYVSAIFKGKTPVVVIDYLQALAPAEPRATDKQNIDRAVMGLKRISVEFKLPIIVVSSINRRSYGRDISMASFKEPGAAIEYSSDVLIGLQQADMQVISDENITALKMHILKNRNGEAGGRICLYYHPRFNYFEERKQ